MGRDGDGPERTAEFMRSTSSQGRDGGKPCVPSASLSECGNLLPLAPDRLGDLPHEERGQGCCQHEGYPHALEVRAECG
jgi:hypothetical protein